jgi:hypothetical protein
MKHQRKQNKKDNIDWKDKIRKRKDIPTREVKPD